MLQPVLLPFRVAIGAWRHVSRTPEFAEGARSISAGYLGTFIFGLVVGIAMVKAGLTPLQAIALNLLVYSGTAQLAALPVIASGGSFAIVWMTTAILNARFVLYSAMTAPEFRRSPLGLRLFMGLTSSDSTLAAYLGWRRAGQGIGQRRRFYLGAVLSNWVYWHTGTILGVLAAGLLPSKGDVLLVATMAALALVGPMIVCLPTLAAAASGIVVSIAGIGWPWRLNIIAAIAAAMIAGKVCVRLAPARNTTDEADPA